jgi:agmatinase
MLPESRDIRDWNEKGKAHATRIIEVGGAIGTNSDLKHDLETVNRFGEKLNAAVYSEVKRLYAAGKIPGVVGGDHSVPFGAIQAAGEVYKSFGVLHFDAHSDTRDAFEGFQWSHASIMRNVLDRVPSVTKLVQVGIRDVCEEEIEYTHLKKSRMQVFSDRDCSRRRLDGVSFGQIARDIVAALPHDVWISFDIDGFDPRLCPHTGTPVPGGLDFNEANLIFSTLVKSGRRIIGFDLNEVSPNLKDSGDEWDANVGARLLYKLCAWALASQSKAKLQLA